MSKLPAMLSLDTRCLEIQNVSSDSFRVVETSTDNSVLWAELFKDNERRFLKKEMQTSILRLMLRDTYQVVARAVWQPEVKGFRGPGYRPGKCALLLHGTGHHRSSGWTWAKFAKPLYQRGFSVVALDLPGFGGSCINNKCDVKVDSWRHYAGEIVVQCLNELSVDRVHIVAAGLSCEFALKIMEQEPRRLAVHHIFHNPIFDLDKLVGTANLDLTRPAGMPYEQWRAVVRSGQLVELEKILRRADVTIYSSFDEASLELVLDARNAIVELQMMTARMARRLPIEQVSSADICEAAAGAAVSLRIFVFSRCLRDRLAEFVSTGFLNTEAAAQKDMLVRSTTTDPLFTQIRTQTLPMPPQTQPEALFDTQRQRASRPPSRAASAPDSSRESSRPSMITNANGSSGNERPAWGLRHVKALQHSLSDVTIVRHHMLSKIPRAQLPDNLDKYRTPLDIEPEMRHEEREHLEDAVDASLGMYVKQMKGKHHSIAELGRQGQTKEKRREAWKLFNTSMRSIASRKS